MKKIILACGLLLTSVGLSQADFVTNVTSVSLSSDSDSIASIAKFDSNLGTLTGIYIEFTLSLYGAVVRVDNDNIDYREAQAAISGSINYIDTVRLDGTGIVPEDDFSIYESKLLTLDATSGDSTSVYNTTGASDNQIWTLGNLAATKGGYVDSSVFSDYIGTGNFDVTVNSTYGINYIIQSKVRWSNTNPSGEFSANVIYEYVAAAVPEPAAVGLISLGGILTLIVSRIRRR